LQGIVSISALFGRRLFNVSGVNSHYKQNSLAAKQGIDQMLVERISMGSDLDPFAATGDYRS
jgi:hypothetical protein